jgi:hypothetical protein
MEKPLKVTEPFYRIGRERVNFDYAPSIRKRYFWIVEAKPGAPKDMQMGDTRASSARAPRCRRASHALAAENVSRPTERVGSPA